MVVLFFLESIRALTMVAPITVTISGMALTILMGNSLGRFRSQAPINHPAKIAPIASRTKGEVSFGFSSFIGFVGGFLEFLRKQNVTIRKL